MRINVLLLLSLIVSNIWAENSPKITRVLDYCPAPSQHINRLFPPLKQSQTKQEALNFAKSCLIDNKKVLGLGAFGGYVVVGFDHSIINKKGEYDFKGLGNAFKGSAEAGILMVCQDLNNNGKPDKNEPWYQLAGSEYNNPQTIHNYQITYHKPTAPKQDIKWTDNQGNSGYIEHISFATQESIFPNWIKEQTITFKGTKLPNNAKKTGENSWELTPFEYGYIDNVSNNESIEKNGFKIDWAKDEKGQSVQLEYIDFIKVYTAQLQQVGWLGETWTEFMGIEDLHPDEKLDARIDFTQKEKVKIVKQNNFLIVLDTEDISYLHLFNSQGKKIIQVKEQNKIDIQKLKNGIYILQIIQKSGKQITTKIFL